MDLLRKLWTFLWGEEDYYTRGSQAVSNDGVFDRRDYLDEGGLDDEDLEEEEDAEDEDDEDFEDDEDDAEYEDEEEE